MLALTRRKRRLYHSPDMDAKVLPTRQTSSPRRAYLVGIAGSGMRSLAMLLHQLGWRVSGCDSSATSCLELYDCGIAVARESSAAKRQVTADLVVHSSAVGADHPELRRAATHNIRTLTYAQALAEFTAPQKTIAIAGTHGKSTVAAMTATILQHAGLDPSFVFGARPQHGTSGGHYGGGEHAIVEACEYREHFLELTPAAAVVLNVEPDHFDCFPTTESLHAAFDRFAARVPSDGFLLVPDSDAWGNAFLQRHNRNLQSENQIAGANISPRIATFGFAPHCQWRAARLEHSRGRYRFALLRRGRTVANVTLAVPGKHQVLNAVAAAALARHCGVSGKQIAAGLAAFRGLRQRLENRGTRGGITWIDDYAHHPTAVTAALNTVKQQFPRRRVFVIFQPHQASRLSFLLDEFARSLHNAAWLAVADVFRAREEPPRGGEPTAATLAEKISKQCPAGTTVCDVHSTRDTFERLEAELQPGDLVLTMGAGDLGENFHHFFNRLGRVRAAA